MPEESVGVPLPCIQSVNTYLYFKESLRPNHHYPLNQIYPIHVYIKLQKLQANTVFLFLPGPTISMWISRGRIKKPFSRC